MKRHFKMSLNKTAVHFAQPLATSTSAFTVLHYTSISNLKNQHF